jgi:hypothetical protein
MKEKQTGNTFLKILTLLKFPKKHPGIMGYTWIERAAEGFWPSHQAT